MRRFTILLVGLFLTWQTTLPAQAAPAPAPAPALAPLCWRARPKPACGTFVVTDFGGYVLLGRDHTQDTPFRMVADWGLMRNVGARNAVGVSVFASVDRLGFALGPAIHYRRWIGGSASVETAVGIPVTTTSQIQPGSVFGLVKWSPNHWLAVAARPELIRTPVFLGCGPTSCATSVQTRGRVSLGLETGWVPGSVLTVLGGGALALLAALLAGSD